MLSDEDAITFHLRLRVARTVEEESALVSETRPSGMNSKDENIEISGLRSLEAFSKITIFTSCVLSKTIWSTWLRYRLTTGLLIYPGGGHPPPTLYGIVRYPKRHLEEAKGACTFNPLDYKDKR